MVIVINQYGEFVAGSNPVQSRFRRYTSGRFVSEYPDATQFPTLSSARYTVKAMKQTDQYCATYYAVTNYGMDSETRERIG